MRGTLVVLVAVLAIVIATEEPQNPRTNEQTPQLYHHHGRPGCRKPVRPSYNGRICHAEGYVRDRYDCTKFYYCRIVDREFIIYPFDCPAPLLFDTTLSVCNWPKDVRC